MMKRLKLILALLSVSILCACLGLFAACREPDDPNGPEEKTYYTVTVAPYDGEEGTVSVSAPASDKGYEKDEQVTVTVTPAADYEVGEVKVNNAAVSLTEGKYTFKVTDNTVISATFEYIGWFNIAWHEATLGTLTFDTDYNMTLTPEGGEAQAVTILTEGIDLSDGFPKDAIDVSVGTGADVKVYQVSFGTYLVFKQGYTEYTFDSDPITDFSAYAGTWKQYNSENELVITATDATYGGETYSEYYTAFDGSHYVKTKPAVGKPRRYLFGYLDNAESVIYLNLGAGTYHFTKDGTLPKAAFPAEFYGEWWNETYYTLAVSAAGATLNESREVSAFAVLGAGEDAVVHVYYNGGYWTVYMQKNADTSESEVVMNNGTTAYVFTAVKPELLPTEYRGTWTELGGDETFTVDSNGNLTYEGKTRETTRDSQDFGFHFLTEAGKKATLMYFPNGGVLALDDGDGHITYYAKTPLGELNDIDTKIPAGTWTSGTKTLTVSADKKITIAEGTEAAKPVRLVFEDTVPMDDVTHYNGEAIYDGVYYTIDYNTETGAITLGYYDDLENGTTTTLTFTKNAQGGTDPTDPTVTIPSAYEDVKGTWSEVTAVGSPRTLVISDNGNIKVSGTDVTTTADFSGEEFKLTVGGTQYTVMFAPEVGDSVDHGALVFVPSSSSGDYLYFRNTAVQSKEIGAADLASTRWTNSMTSMNIHISADGALDCDGEDAFILSYAEESGTPQWTMFLNGMFLMATVSGNKLSLYDLEGFQSGTAMLEFDRETVGVTFPANLRGEWVCTTFSAPESIGGSSSIDKQVSLVIATDTAKWGTEDIKTVTDAGEGKYSFTTTSPVDGDDATTYTFWLQGDNILLLDDGTQTYALFKADWTENNLEIAVKAPDAYGTGEWTGANGEKLQITVPGDNEEGHEVFITVKDKKLDGDPIWLLGGPTATLAKGYIKPVGPSHYVYAEMSVSEETITVKLFFKFSAPDVYTFTKGGGTVEETYKVPIDWQAVWTLYTNGALDSNHVIEMEQKSITFDGAAVTEVVIADDAITFKASNGKKYTAKFTEDLYMYAIYVQAEGEETYAIYVSEFADEVTFSARATAVKGTTWTSTEGKGNLVIDADGTSITLNGEKIFVLVETTNPAEGFGSPTFKGFQFVVGGMWYEAVFTGTTMTLTDLDGHTYNYTKQA